MRLVIIAIMREGMPDSQHTLDHMIFQGHFVRTLIIHSGSVLDGLELAVLPEWMI